MSSFERYLKKKKIFDSHVVKMKEQNRSRDQAVLYSFLMKAKINKMGLKTTDELLEEFHLKNGKGSDDTLFAKIEKDTTASVESKEDKNQNPYAIKKITKV